MKKTIEAGYRDGSSVSASDAFLDPKTEMALAKSLSPQFAWPTVLLAIILPIVFAVTIQAGVSDIVPAYLVSVPLGVMSYAHYTIVHECIHNNLFPRGRHWSGLNQFFGWIGALALGASWPSLRRTHLLHHSHTNTQRDPDIYVKGSFSRLCVRWLVMAPMAILPFWAVKIVSPKAYEGMKATFVDGELLQVHIASHLTLSLLLFSVIQGALLKWILLWFLPIRIGVFLLNVLFQWLPHYPFESADRYRNTRLSYWPFAKFVTFYQNLHLIHHLWPSVPFYRYGRLTRSLDVVLRRNQVRTEGLRPHSNPHVGKDAP